MLAFLQPAIQALTIPGLPEWTGLVAALLLALLGGCLLLMPFSVFGVKGRLEAMEAQLDEIRAELRALAARLPESRGGGLSSRYAETEIELPNPAPRAEPAPRGAAGFPAQAPGRGPARAEPRVGWPKR